MNQCSFADRIALAASEHRQELGLSLCELAEWSGLDYNTVFRLERGLYVRPELALRVAAALTVLDMYRPPPVDLVDEFRALFVDAERAWST